MSRYLVIEVGCLECNAGDADPEVVFRAGSFDVAAAEAIRKLDSSDSDRFVLDTETGDVSSSRTLESRSER